ncbi:MAG: Fur family transcriptional regulator [Syntrophobacteraceae bacterium]
MHSEKDYRVTRQRRIILEEMRAMRRHPTACELYDAVKRRLPRISLATVYRNLEILSEKGLIKKIEAGGRKRRFDSDPAAHHHAHCMQCGAIIDIPSDPEIVSRLRAKSADLEYFEVLEARIEFFGRCGACRAGEIPAEPTQRDGETRSDSPARQRNQS